MSDCWESREKFANLIPNFTFAFCLVLCFLASAFAHLFNCISVEVRKFVFVIDYTGVGLNALGAGISYTAYMPEDFIPTGSRNIYSVMMVIMVWLATIGCSVAMVYLSDRPVAQPLKAVSFGTIAIQGNVPMVAYLHHLSSTDSNSAALVTQYFWYYFLFKLIAGFFLASCIPEKLSPSKFDLFGHSHQLFHVAGFLCLNFQYKLGHSLASINPVESLETTRWRVLVTLILCFFGFTLIVLFFKREIKRLKQLKCKRS